MYWNDIRVDTVELSGPKKELFEGIGYKFKQVEVRQNRYKSLGTFEKIPIHAKLEFENNCLLLEPYEIRVSYHAKDIIEVAAHGMKILNKIKEMTGIEGHGDIFGKMERC